MGTFLDIINSSMIGALLILMAFSATNAGMQEYFNQNS